MDLLESAFEYYKKNKNELLKKYSGKFLVIKNNKIIGIYSSESEAYEETVKTEKLGTFLIQLCSPTEDEVVQTFHSRVNF